GSAGDDALAPVPDRAAGARALVVRVLPDRRARRAVLAGGSAATPRSAGYSDPADRGLELRAAAGHGASATPGRRPPDERRPRPLPRSDVRQPRRRHALAD